MPQGAEKWPISQVLPWLSHLYSGNWRGLGPISQAALPISLPSLPINPLPASIDCFGCEAPVAAALSPLPCPQHRLALCSLPRSFCLSLSLTTPISASSFLLGSRFLLPPLCPGMPAVS